MRPKPVQTNPEEEGTTDFLLEHKRALVTVTSTSAKKGLQHEALPLTKVGIFQKTNENIVFLQLCTTQFCFLDGIRHSYFSIV